MAGKRDRLGVHHHPSVEPLTQAFARGRRRRISGNARTMTAQTEAQIAHDYAAELLREAASNDDLLVVAEEFGFVHLIATLAGQRNEALNALGMLGHAYRGWSSRDHDAGLQVAHDQLHGVAAVYKRRGEFRSAAIYETNAATALLEKYAVTREDLRLARDYLDYSRRHKSPASVDWAYTEFSTGIYYVQSRAATPAEHVENLRIARGHFDSAIDLFNEHEEPLSVVVMGEYAHLLANQVDAARDKRVAEAVLTHLNELPAEIMQHAEANPNQYGNAIYNNPVSLGFAAIPPWLAEAIGADLDAETTSSLRTAAARSAEMLARPVNSDRAGLQHARWWLARARWELDKSADNLDWLFDAASALQDEPDPALFMEYAVYACWVGRTYLGVVPRPETLQAIATAYLRMVEHGTDETEIASFIKHYDHQVRFVACSLADLGLWDEAVAVLEATRVLIYRSDAVLPATSTHSSQSTTSWVYITHSPEASYIIVVRDGQPTRGQILTTMSGKHLVASTMSIIQGQIGLLSAQWSYPTNGLTEAVARIMTDLQPIADTIVALTPEGHGLALLPSGLYTGLPVAATISELAPSRYPFVATAPARHVVDTRPYTWRFDESTLYAFGAPQSPGWNSLRYPALETRAIAACVPASRTGIFDDVTRDEFVSAAIDCNVLHFSGHSYSDTENPLQSALILHDGEFTLEDLVATPRPHLNMVTLSSCQSSTPAISGLSSEALGLHTAFHYAGCPFVIGSLWPVFDITATVFMTRFYTNLSVTDIIGLSAISATVRDTQQWMKTATLSEIATFLAGLHPSISLPDVLAHKPSDSVPFAEPRAWAPFYVAATRL